MKTDIKFFCPRLECPYYQNVDNKIVKSGTYTTILDSTPRQMFYCSGGQHDFSETAYSELFGKHGSFKEYEQTAKLCKYALSTEQIADVLDKDPRTIKQWQKAIGEKSRSFHLYICSVIGLILRFLQMDELWSYCRSKAHQLWIFIALEPKSKFWINFEVGSRTKNTAKRLIKQVNEFINTKCKEVIRITTDKLRAYENALESCFSYPYAYLQIVKKRIKYRLKTVKKYFVKGSEKDFPTGTQNTSFIERFNLTLRQRISFLVRKTLGYAKKKINCDIVLWINLFDYNYIQFHKSLRVRINESIEKFTKRYYYRTPAMAMGLTSNQLSWRYLFTVPIK